MRNPGESQPNYKQGAIVAELTRRLDSDFYSGMFPIAADLAGEFGVNVKTVNKALAQLVESGRLRRKRGVGTLILERHAEQSQIEALFEGYNDLFSHPFWADIWQGCLSQLLDNGCRPVLTRCWEKPASEQLALDHFEFSASAGKLLLGVSDPKLIAMLQSQHCPAVSVGDELSSNALPQVVFNYHPGVSRGIDYLCDERNCRRILFLGVTSSEYNPGLVNKYTAFIAACRARGIFKPELAAYSRPLPWAAAETLAKVIDRGEHFDGIFVGCDHQVPAVRELLAERGLDPDTPILGCDGLEMAQWPTVALPRRIAGKSAAELLLSLIRDPKYPTNKVVLNSDFVK